MFELGTLGRLKWRSAAAINIAAAAPRAENKRAVFASGTSRYSKPRSWCRLSAVDTGQWRQVASASRPNPARTGRAGAERAAPSACVCGRMYVVYTAGGAAPGACHRDLADDGSVRAASRPPEAPPSTSCLVRRQIRGGRVVVASAASALVRLSRPTPALRDDRIHHHADRLTISLSCRRRPFVSWDRYPATCPLLSDRANRKLLPAVPYRLDLHLDSGLTVSPPLTHKYSAPPGVSIVQRIPSQCRQRTASDRSWPCAGGRPAVISPPRSLASHRSPPAASHGRRSVRRRGCVRDRLAGALLVLGGDLPVRQACGAHRHHHAASGAGAHRQVRAALAVTAAPAGGGRAS